MLWAAADPGADVTNPVTWINFGVLGLVVLGGMTGWFHFKPEVDRLEKEIDRLHVVHEKEIDRLDTSHTNEAARMRTEYAEQIRLIREDRDKATVKVDAMAEIYKTELLPSLNKFLSTIEILLPMLQRQAGDQK